MPMLFVWIRKEGQALYDEEDVTCEKATREGINGNNAINEMASRTKLVIRLLWNAAGNYAFGLQHYPSILEALHYKLGHVLNITSFQTFVSFFTWIACMIDGTLL